MFKPLVLISLTVLLSSCANPSITNIQPAALALHSAAPIYIARFEGNPDFVEEATALFVAQLQTKTQHKIIQGDAVRTEGPDILRGGNIPSRQMGIANAKAAGAKLLIVGKVTSHHTGGMMNGFVTIHLIDVGTGNLVGTIHRPSRLLIAYSDHQCVLAAAKSVANALGKNL